MEVGIEDCLHIEFEYERTSFHLQDVVLGKIFFLLVCLFVFEWEDEEGICFSVGFERFGVAVVLR
jgi:hypothetical protein